MPCQNYRNMKGEVCQIDFNFHLKLFLTELLINRTIIILCKMTKKKRKKKRKPTQCELISITDLL